MGGLGISSLIFLKSIFYLSVSLLFNSYGFPLLSIPFLYASLVSFLISIASHPQINLPMLLGKNPNGTFSSWSILMFAPFLLFVRFFSLLRRFVHKEEPYTEVSEGLFVGGWPFSPEMLPPGNPAIVDCTVELPRRPECFGNAYMCVPTWDTRAPNPSDIESAVKWASRKRAQGVPVFIHCAYGHGRSVAVMCALLVALEIVDDWKNAEKLIQQTRPFIRMNSLHREALDEWSKHRLSPPKRQGEGLVSSVIASDAF